MNILITIVQSITGLVGVACYMAGFGLCLFSSWSAREAWRSEMVLWVAGAFFLQLLGLGLIINSTC